MLKGVILLMLICVSGCQTVSTGSAVEVAQTVSVERRERLLLRTEKMVGTYEVMVQRIALVGESPRVSADWKIEGTVVASGYPGKFRRSEDSLAVADTARIGSYLLAGEVTKISHEPGVHLVVKVIPELQNTARVLGIYVQVTQVGEHFETFSYPFDVHCNLGEVIQLYSKEIPLLGEHVSGVDQL